MDKPGAAKAHSNQVEKETAGSVRLIPGRQFCWISGMAQRPPGYHGEWWLHAAHLGSGSGSMLREDDRRGVVLLSPIAHQCHVAAEHSDSVFVINGKKYPAVTSANLIYIKRCFDPEYYDWDYICRIWTGDPPDPAPPHVTWQRMLFDNQRVVLRVS